MNIPPVEQPERYGGLYIFEFEGWTGLGYTAEEIAFLLEHERYRSGKVYRIVRARPDGTFELKGVPLARFQLESGVFCYRAERGPAEADFDDLIARAERTPPPARAFVHLADRGPVAGPNRFVTALIYPAERDEDFGRWLLDIGYAGGDLVEGGCSAVTNYYEERPAVQRRQQLWSRSAIPSRSREEVLRSVRQAVQR